MLIDFVVPCIFCVKYECNNDIMNYINQKLVVMRQRMTVFDLSSILIKPVQRILKYPLLLSELLKVRSQLFLDFNVQCICLFLEYSI